MKSKFDPKAELGIVATRDFYDGITADKDKYPLVDVTLKNCRIECITPAKEIDPVNGNVYLCVYLNNEEGITFDFHS